jgi:hypothetical protein
MFTAIRVLSLPSNDGTSSGKLNIHITSLGLRKNNTVPREFVRDLTLIGCCRHSNASDVYLGDSWITSRLKLFAVFLTHPNSFCYDYRSYLIM